ncbi:uncharacterized protein LOC135961410 [Calliphora vicina]|uniref:uncharacterized protein LOC135961410 n=1 Tax=Calliphora vicina TaxID=7373 RepID=UPI00325C23DE
MTTQNGIATELKNLLSKWKLECILSHLLAEKIDTEIFQMMKLPHIRLLLHNFPLGIQIRFEYNLEQWRKDIGNPFQTATIEDRLSCVTSTVHNFKTDLVKNVQQDKEIQTDLIIYNVNSTAQTNNEHNRDVENAACSGAAAEDPLSKTEFDLPSEHITPGMSNTFKKPLQTPPVDLRTILSHSPRGISLIKNYRFRKRFSNAERNLLISDIVNYYLENNIEFNVQISYALERAILKMFHTEKLSYYRTTKRGGLYMRYLSAKAAMKQEVINYNESVSNMDYSALDKEDSELSDQYSVDSQIMEEVFHTETPVISDVSHFENEDNETIVSDNNISMEADYIKLEPEIMWSEQVNPPQKTMSQMAIPKCACCQEVSKRLDTVLEILDEHKVLLDRVVSQNVNVENIISIFPINTEEKLKEFDGLLALQSEPYIQQIKNLMRGNVERNLNQIFGKTIIMDFNVDGTFGKKGLRDYSNVLTAIIDVISTFSDSPDKTLRAAFQRQKKKYFKENSRSNSKVKVTNDENVQESYFLNSISVSFSSSFDNSIWYMGITKEIGDELYQHPAQVDAMQGAFFVNVSETSSLDSMAVVRKIFSKKQHESKDFERPFKNFSIPWHKVPYEVTNLLENKQQLGKGLNVIANLIIDELRSISKQIPIRVLRGITQQAVMKYPHSFLNKDAGGNNMSTTSVPLLSRLRNRHYHINYIKFKHLQKDYTKEEIDVDILAIMKMPHIKSLLCDFSLGIQIRFEHKFQQWRQRIGKPLKYDEYDETNEFIIKEPSEEAINKFQNDSRTASINLRQILMQSKPEGPAFFEIYRDNQPFSNPERSCLIDLIVNYYLKNDLAIDLHVSYDLENAILSLFPSERLDLYRIRKEGKIYTKYLAAKAVYNNRDVKDLDSDVKRDANLRSRNVKQNKMSRETSSVNRANENSMIAPDNIDENKNMNSSGSTRIPAEILLQTVYNDCKKFVKIFEPFLFQEFFSAACSSFNIANSHNFYVAINECEISADNFKDAILQYYKLPTFNIELKERAAETKLEHLENSCSPADFYTQSNIYSSAKNFNTNEHNNTAVQIIVNHLPDANDIRNIPSLLPIVKMSDDGRPLENKHRTTIAKAVIDECLNFQPERVLKRQDFFTLTDNLVQAFPNEIASAYFIPSQPNHAARGKLWNAYNNKRSFLGSSGIVQRRQHSNVKRKLQSDEDEGSEKTNDKIYVTEKLVESKDFCLNSILDWDTLQQKWSQCHQERRNELLKDKMPPQYYMQKYSILKSNRGVDLMEIDVNILHPTVVNISNWLSLHEKVIEMGRKLQKVEHIPRILENIDSSNDEKYRASLALVILPYIFPYNARRNEFNEKASKYDTQKRFIKEYASLDDLNADIECAELQIRFVHCSQQINYAEFKICGHVFKCVDLLEALSSIFHYSVALDMEYPKICQHIWQFIQLAIFQIEIQGCKQPNVESTINDLYMI